MDNSIFEVSRAEYKSFIEEIKPEYRRVEEVELDKWYKATKVFSKKTDKCLASRVTHLLDGDKHEPERYYIFEMPDDDERQAAIPRIKVVLETKEQVQAFLDGIKKMKEQGI